MNEEAVERFIRDNYPGEFEGAVQAIRDIAKRYGIAVAYLDRQVFDSYVDVHLNRPLTPEEWERVKDFGDEYDQFVDATPGPTGNDVCNEFIRYWLDECGVSGPDGGKWSEA